MQCLTYKEDLIQCNAQFIPYTSDCRMLWQMYVALLTEYTQSSCLVKKIIMLSKIKVKCAKLVAMCSFEIDDDV
jgi:hypothetical protein